MCSSVASLNGEAAAMRMAIATSQARGGSREVASSSVNAKSHSIAEYRVLIVEDDADIAQLIGLELEELPARVDIVRDGAAGLEAATSGRYDLIALDLRLPRVGGLEICRRLRQQGLLVPILVVSARSSESDRIVGLELGADDYIVKPFSPAELLARARALLRRSSMRAGIPSPSEELRVGDLRIDVPGRAVWVRDRKMPLTPKEFDLLTTLAKHAGRAFKKTELLAAVWGQPYEGYEHTLTCHINRLRAKIEADPQNPRRILTVWGVGYKMSD